MWIYFGLEVLCSVNLLLCLGFILVFLVGLSFMRIHLVALCFFTPVRTLCNQSAFIELRELVGLSLLVTCGTTVSTVIVITKTYRYIIFLLLTLMWCSTVCCQSNSLDCIITVTHCLLIYSSVCKMINIINLDIYAFFYKLYHLLIWSALEKNALSAT